MVPEHGDLAIASRRKPIELNDAALADERLMTVPRIVTALERQQSSRDRRYFDDDVVKVVGRAQQSQPASGLIPTLVHVNEDRDDFGG